MTTQTGFTDPHLPETTPYRQLMKFDPTFNTGTIVQIGVIIMATLGVYYSMKQDQALQKQELDFVKASILIERASTKDALLELKVDVRALQISMNAMNESIAVLRGRAAQDIKR